MQAWALLTKSKWIQWLKHKVTKDVAIGNYNLRFLQTTYQEKKEERAVSALSTPLTYCEVVAVVARQPHKLEVGGSIPPHARDA